MAGKFNHYLPVYKNLEEELINLSKYIQINDDQLDVYSMHIADLIVRCAMEIEALSKELYWLNGGQQVFDKEGKKRDLFFDTDCINLLNSLWGICDKEILVSSENFYFEQSENIQIKPLRKANVRSGALWNKSYQAVKHDRIKCLKHGNIKSLIHALGALYILNLYYIDKDIDLGTTNTPMQSFDSRMGSRLFSATVADATINVKMGADEFADVFENDFIEQSKSAIYVLRYKLKGWEDTINAIRADNDKLLHELIESQEFKQYLAEHINEFKNEKNNHLLSLVSKVLGPDYIRKHGSLSGFGQAFLRAEKEAILNKKAEIYPKNSKVKCVIMAGGKGTRISELFPDIPKPLIPIDDVPVLEREIRSLREQGFIDIIITVSHMHENIEEYFGDGKRFGVNIEYFVEDTPLGNAGALFKLRDKLSNPFLLLNADAMFDVDFSRMLRFHKKHGALVTLFTHPNSHPYDSGIVIAGDDGAVQQWLTKEDPRPTYYKNRVNAGLHVIDPKVLDRVDIDANLIGTEGVDGKIIKIDLDRQILKPLCGTHTMFCYDSPEYVKDMGTPERFNSVSADFANGVVSAKNLSNPQKAIFLDRDGTINKYVGFLRDINDFELIDGVAEAIKLINSSGYLAIVVTNQPVIARGEVTVEELDLIHNKMETLLGKAGAYVDALYYCPHHPHKGYEGEVPELKIDCDCRKPKPGMLIQASSDFNIDLSKSFMIGDGENDVKCGIAAGCKTVLIGEGEYGQDLTCTSLLEAVQKILG